MTRISVDELETKNPLVRDGVAQLQRQTRSLDPTSVQVYEKDLADFLVFAHDLSRQINFYNLNNEKEDSWQAFFERSAAIQIARISKTRPETVRQQYDQALQALLQAWGDAPAENTGDLSTKLALLEAVLDVYCQLLNDLQTWYQSLADGSELKGTFSAIVKTNLPYPVKTLCRLEQGLMRNRLACAYHRTQVYQQVTRVFGTLSCSIADPNLLANAPGDGALSIELARALPNKAVAEAELDGIFQPIFQTYRQIIELAPTALQATLQSDGRLPAHLSLYVAFWEILKPAHADLNRMTQRHLDFFYREVLRLSEKPAEPDRAHVFFELDKFQQAFKLSEKAQLSAGTDESGADLFYTLDEEIVVNTAQVAELKALFVQDAVVYASPVANSFDGAGAEFPKGAEQQALVQTWLPFGDDTRPKAALGLAIASHSLLLSEGDRTITFTLTLNLPTALPFTPLINVKGADIPALQILLSGEEAWITGEIQSLSFTPNTPEAESTITQYIATIVVVLPVEADAVVPYHSELADGDSPVGTLPTTKPVAQLIVHPNKPTDTVYEGLLAALQQAQLEAVTVTTKVVGARRLLLQNDLALLETDKPLQPFGPQPKAGSHFYVGAPDVLNRALTSLKLSFEVETPIPDSWYEKYAAYGVDQAFSPGKLAIASLDKRQWFPAGGVEGGLFDVPLFPDQPPQERFHYQIDLTDRLLELRLTHQVKEQFSSAAESLLPWSYESQSGFLRLQLQRPDFLHDQYPTVLARQILAAATQEVVTVNVEDKAAIEAAKQELSDALTHLNELTRAQSQALTQLTSAQTNVREKEPIGDRTRTQLAAAERSVSQIEQDIRLAEIFNRNDEATRSRLNERLEQAQSERQAAQERNSQAQSDIVEAKRQAEQAEELLDTISNQVSIAQTRLTNATTEMNKPRTLVPQERRKAIVGAYYRLSDNSIEEAKEPLIAADATPLLPTEPYTPVLKNVQLDYEAIATQEACDFFHLHPFNGIVSLPSLSQDVALLPQFTHEGELLIGLQNLAPSTALSLLFQVVEETANTDLPRTPLSWHYLINNQWQAFENYDVLQDSSQGLIRSGIVKLAIPADISRDRTTILNPAFHWIKATVSQNSGAVAHILAVHTQAVEVTFSDNNNDPQHLAQPLPPASITALAADPSEIKEVQQPYPSFDGQTKEPNEQFYTRISEHLRHKGRAVNIFDYEHLVLSQFPDVYKVRCINHGRLNERSPATNPDVESPQLREVAPGYTTLAVIPKLSLHATSDNLKPKVNINVLADIETYLKSVSSPWATLQVINPQYEQIRVSFSVMFHREFYANAAFYQRQLEKEIISFLSPWSVDGNAEIHFGGEIYRSSILKFVEDRDYVDYVLNFQLLKGLDNTNRTRVSASAPHSILVSVPFLGETANHELTPQALHHRIVSLNPKDTDRPPPPSDNLETQNKLGYNPLSRLTLGE